MSKILVVDDEPAIVELVEDALSEENYSVSHAYSGEEAIALLESELPDLVLLDIMLPGMDGYEVSRQMQRDPRLSQIPVIMLTAKSAIPDRVNGYERGADDYITKPFDMDELLIRVRAQLRYRTRETRSALTGLPGNEAVKNAIETRTINSEEEWAIIYADIEGFTAYSEEFSFARGNELIRQTANLLQTTLQESGEPGDFIGYVGGENFVIITTPARAQAVGEAARRRFEKILPGFFTPTHLQNGYFLALNHQGQKVKQPLVSLSFDVVDNRAEEAV